MKVLALEGGEGSGKGTTLKNLIDYFFINGISYEIAREPGGCNISEDIRNVILNKNNTNMTPITEAYLYAAARLQLISEIEQNFQDKDIVLFDRSIYSSFAYQGHARGLGIDLIKDINKYVYKDGKDYIDYVIFLKLDPKQGIDRIMTNRSDEINRLDLETLDFHEKVQEGYNLLAKEHPEKFIVIDANQTPKEILDDIVRELRERDIL